MSLARLAIHFGSLEMTCWTERAIVLAVDHRMTETGTGTYTVPPIAHICQVSLHVPTRSYDQHLLIHTPDRRGDIDGASLSVSYGDLLGLLGDW